MDGFVGHDVQATPDARGSRDHTAAAWS